MSYNMKSLEEFLDKYSKNYSVDIILINKQIGDNIYKINISDKKYNSLISKLSDIETVTNNVQKYYHNDKYIEIIDDEIKYKKNTIIDKLLIDNFLLIAKKVDILESTSIPGLSKYDYQENYNSSVYNISGVELQLIRNNNNHNCVLKINNSLINDVKHVITNYLL